MRSALRPAAGSLLATLSTALRMAHLRRAAVGLTTLHSRLATTVLAHSALKAATLRLHLAPLAALRVIQNTVGCSRGNRVALTQTLHLWTHCGTALLSLAAHRGTLGRIAGNTVCAHPLTHRVHCGTCALGNALALCVQTALDGIELCHLTRGQVKLAAGVEHRRDTAWTARSDCCARRSQLRGAGRGSPSGALCGRLATDADDKAREGEELRGGTHC